MLRPDLSNVSPEIIAYIEYLEKRAGLRQRQSASAMEDTDLAPAITAVALPAERETDASILTVTRAGLAKRTLRHLYTRQHRGGMGGYGIDLADEDTPALLSCIEDSHNVLLFTNRARVFRYALSSIASTQVMDSGSSIIERLGLEAEEWIVAALPVQARGYISLVSAAGRVRTLRHHMFGEHMRPGMAVYNFNDFGPLVSAAWTPGDADLFLLTRNGIAIRFAEKAISPQGDQGIRLSGDDQVVSLAPVDPDSGVFIVSADGRGTIRQMSGFAPNKTPGGSGKIAIKSSKAVGACTVEINDDIFLLTRLGKVIRFPAAEVPSTEGVVQGVNCMGLRGDEILTVLKAGPIY